MDIPSDTPQERPLSRPSRWSKPAPRLVILTVLASVALVLVYFVDAPLWRHSRFDRLVSEWKNAEATLKLIDTRLTTIGADLKTSKEIAERQDASGAGKSVPTPTELTSGETKQYRAMLLAERVVLTRQRVEVESKSSAASEALDKLRPDWRNPRNESAFIVQLLDRSTYLHAAFHIGAFGTVVLAYAAAAGVLLLLFGTFLSAEIRSVLDFLARHFNLSSASSAIMPMIATLAGAGAIAAGVASATLASPGAPPQLDSPPAHVDSNPPTRHGSQGEPGTKLPAVPVPVDTAYVALVVQPIIERSEKTTMEIRETLEKIDVVVRDMRSVPAVVQVTGQVEIAGHQAALDQLFALQRAANEQLQAANVQLEKVAKTTSLIEGHTGEAERDLDDLNKSISTAAQGLGALQKATVAVETHSQQASKASNCLVQFEEARASRGFGGRVRDLFTGMKGCETKAAPAPASAPAPVPVAGKQSGTN